MVVAVNKTDKMTANYSEKRYNEIKTEISNFLKRTGFNPDKIPFAPISGFIGDNTIERSKNMPWYEGSTLLEALDNVKDLSSPLRILCAFRCRTSPRSRALGLSPLGVLRRAS